MLTTNCGFQGAPQGQALLVHHGPEIQVNIGFDLNYKPEQNAPPVAKVAGVRALIDTGARESCIDSALAQRIKLPHFDRRIVSGVTGPVEVDFYLAQIHVPMLRFTQRGFFAGVPLIASGFQHEALVGRSFLSYVSMEYDGPRGMVAISF